MPLTTTGVEELAVVPFPNSPLWLLPQHRPAALANNAHEWVPTTEISMALVRPLTATAVDESASEPFPN